VDRLVAYVDLATKAFHLVGDVQFDLLVAHIDGEGSDHQLGPKGLAVVAPLDLDPFELGLDPLEDRIDEVSPNAYPISARTGSPAA
jgi:hypothetical protein